RRRDDRRAAGGDVGSRSQLVDDDGVQPASAPVPLVGTAAARRPRPAGRRRRLRPGPERAQRRAVLPAVPVQGPAADGDRRADRDHYGQSFTVDTPDASRVQKVSLVRMGTVTHNFDMDQRFMNLSMTAGTGQVSIGGPTNANVAPPGWYMVFLIDSN